MRTRNSKTKAFTFLGAAFVLLISLMFTACPNAAGGSGSGGGGTPPVPPPVQTLKKSIIVQTLNSLKCSLSCRF